MQQFAKQLRHSTFVRHNAVFFFGSLTIGALNYLYYPIIGRLLPPSSFGEVQTLFSLFAQILIFLNVLGLVTVNIVTNYDDSAHARRVILELEKLASGVGLLLLAATILSSGVLQRFFSFESAAPFAILVLAIVVSIPLALRSAYLRGKHRFGLASVVGIIAAAGDLIFTIILVLANTGTTGAITGLVLAQAVAVGIAVGIAHRHGFVEHVHDYLARLPDMRLILPELKYALLVLVGSLIITLFYSMDILVVKHYFDARIAGLYAGISTVARIIFFLTASIAQVLMPAVRLTSTHAQNQSVLLKSFFLLFGLGGMTWAVFAIAPRFVIRLLMGAKYLPYADLLPRLSLMVLIVSILNLFVIYHMALRHYMVAVIVLTGFGITLGLIYTYHDSLAAVIDSLLIGVTTLLVLLGVWAIVPKFKTYLQA